jgi:hypothetical protein
MAGDPSEGADNFCRVQGHVREFAKLDQLDWRSFVCAWCGEQTFVGREPHQTLLEFAAMSVLLFGDPPVCSRCQGRVVDG